MLTIPKAYTLKSVLSYQCSHFGPPHPSGVFWSSRGLPHPLKCGGATLTTKCKNSGAVIVAWNGITNYSTSVTPLSHCLPHAHIVLLPHHECTPPTSRTSHRTRTTPDLFAPGPHGAYDVEPNVTATFLNVPPTCANSPIDVPCASAHATSYRPPLFYCQFSTQSGYKSDAVVTSGPFHAFAYSETVAGVLVGVGVSACSARSQRSPISARHRGRIF